MSEEIAEALEKYYQRAVELTDKWFPETKKYPRDRRLTIITMISDLLTIERLSIERAKVNYHP